MKKILLLAIIMTSLAAKGQLVKNGGFEETFTDVWGNVLPKYWNANFWFMMIDTNTLDKPHSGLRGYVLINNNKPNGYDTVVGNLHTRFALGSIPLKFNAYVKYNPYSANERFLMKATLYNRSLGGDMDTLAVAFIEPDNSNRIINWTKFETKFNYRKNIRPDSAEVIIYASQRNSYTPFTSLVVDDVDFTDTISALSVHDFRKAALIKVYPNPASSLVTINVQNENANDYIINVLDIAGRRLTTTKVFSEISPTVEIDINNFENGIYFISVSTADLKIKETHKIVILK